VVIGEPSDNSLPITRKATGSYCYRVASVRVEGPTNEVFSAYSNLEDITVDGTAPRCTAIQRTANSVTFDVFDADSGLAQIAIANKTNTNPSVQPFTQGTTSPVTVSASRTNPSKKAQFTISARDVVGNRAGCTASGWIKF
jgi:hypothetical protein